MQTQDNIELSSNKMFKRTATTKWEKEVSEKRIGTSCRELDAALSNGIPRGVITEFCGPPGCGKTQLCLQLCVNVQLPCDLDGVDGEAVFIDTNSGYNPYRFRSIAAARINLCENPKKLKKLNPTPELLMDKIMNGIKLYFVTDYGQLLVVIHSLWNVLTENPKIRLIVIDSFSFLFRRMVNDESDVTLSGLLYETMKRLQKLADQFSCAVVLTNELAMRPVDDMSVVLVPSLGDSHVHRVGQLITLGKDDFDSDTFWANIDKTFHSPETLVKFRITENGIQSATSSNRPRTQ